MNANAAQLDRIIRMGEVIAREGMRAAGMDLLLLAHDARDLGVESVLIDVMVDENAPDVVRERAFCRVASAVVVIQGSLDLGDVSAAPAPSSPVGAMS